MLTQVAFPANTQADMMDDMGEWAESHHAVHRQPQEPDHEAARNAYLRQRAERLARNFWTVVLGARASGGA